MALHGSSYTKFHWNQFNKYGKYGYKPVKWYLVTLEGQSTADSQSDDGMFHQLHCMNKMPNVMNDGHTQCTRWEGGVSFPIYLYTLMLVVNRQAAFYITKNITLSLENLLAVTYMQTQQLMSVYSVLHKVINQFEVVVCKGFNPAPISNTTKSHHPNPISSLYCLSKSILQWCSSNGQQPQNNKYNLQLSTFNQATK